MSINNTVRQVAYDNPSAITRQVAQLTANTAGSGSLSGKFYAWAALTVYGVTFATVTAGTSTYTASGTATSPATQFSLIYITNTNTTGTAVTLGTSTIGPFTVGGTGALGSNVGSLLGFGGGVAGGYTGPYAFNTLGGTNTTLAWGTQTFTSSGYPGGQGIGLGGLPVNPGDVLYFVGGTDATASVVPILQYSLQGVSGNIVA
jgi:hypothetical protein